MVSEAEGISLLFAHVGLVLVIFKNPAMGRKGNFSLERMRTVSRSSAANLHSSRSKKQSCEIFNHKLLAGSLD